MSTMAERPRLYDPETFDVDGAPFPDHELHGFCWCQPLVETDPATGDRLYIHRRSLDSPHIEQDGPA